MHSGDKDGRQLPRYFAVTCAPLDFLSAATEEGGKFIDSENSLRQPFLVVFAALVDASASCPLASLRPFL
jgi:hypothetical protein